MVVVAVGRGNYHGASMSESVRAIPGAPPLDQPVPRDPVLEVSLEAYARTSARLASKQPRKQVLDAAKLDERAWLTVEKTWLLRLAVAAMRREMDLVEVYDRAFLDEKRATGG